MSGDESVERSETVVEVWGPKGAGIDNFCFSRRFESGCEVIGSRIVTIAKSSGGDDDFWL